MNQPDTIVKSFIRAHAEWNQRSNKRCKALRSGSREYQSAMKAAETEYGDIINLYGSKAVVPQAISFGDSAMHDPDRESLESVAMDELNATVRTQYVGMFNIMTNYEYRLVKESNEWRISSLLLIDEDGAYECL